MPMRKRILNIHDQQLYITGIMTSRKKGAIVVIDEKQGRQNKQARKGKAMKNLVYYLHSEYYYETLHMEENEQGQIAMHSYGIGKGEELWNI